MLLLIVFGFISLLTIAAVFIIRQIVNWKQRKKLQSRYYKVFYK